MSGRVRTLKPEWLEDELLAGCDDATRLLSAALILLADDHGNGRAAPVFVAGHVWTYSTDPLETVSRKTREGLARLAEIGFLQLYDVSGQNYYSIRNWRKHQRVDRPSAPRVPGPELATPSRDPRETLATDPDLRSPITDLRSRTGMCNSEAPPSPVGDPLPPRSDLFPEGTGTGPPKVGRKTNGKRAPREPDETEHRAVTDVLAELSRRSGVQYRPTGRLSQRLVGGLLRRGLAVHDLLLVVWHKGDEWADSERMRPFLRPSTLFGPKFDEYLAAARAAEVAWNGQAAAQGRNGAGGAS